MARKSRKANSNPVLAFDLGGTKICAGIVTSNGAILQLLREPVDISGGFESLVAQFARMGKKVLNGRKVAGCAIASAGPLDPIAGTLLNPTNLTTRGRKWGVVPLAKKVSQKLKMKVALENDAAASALAEYWVGAGRKTDNLLVVTLGTGVGVGVIVNGALVRSGRHLHTEGGHVLLHPEDKVMPCGCGNFGCAEAFLSGRNFTERMKIVWIERELTGHELVARADAGDKKALEAFEEYGNNLGLFLYDLTVLFSPQRVVLSGGFSHASHLFLSQTKLRLRELLASRRKGHDLMPELKISPFQDESGLLGAAFVALQTTRR